MQYPPYQDNYVDYNAKHITELANCREPRFQIVDSKDGHVMDLVKSGLVPVYLDKHVSSEILALVGLYFNSTIYEQSYGRLPGYLKHNNRLPECERHQMEEMKREPAQLRTEHEPCNNRTHPVRPPVSKEIEVLRLVWLHHL